jgi:hypothetical protein
MEKKIVFLSALVVIIVCLSAVMPTIQPARAGYIRESKTWLSQNLQLERYPLDRTRWDKGTYAVYFNVNAWTGYAIGTAVTPITTVNSRDYQIVAYVIHQGGTWTFIRYCYVEFIWYGTFAHIQDVAIAYNAATAVNIPVWNNLRPDAWAIHLTYEHYMTFSNVYIGASIGHEIWTT